MTNPRRHFIDAIRATPDLTAPLPPSVTIQDAIHILDRLEQFEQAAATLFPYVRYFGLCGADLAAVEAVARLAELLGQQQESTVSPQDIAQQARRQTLAEIAHRIESREQPWGSGILGSSRREIVKQLRGEAGV